MASVTISEYTSLTPQQFIAALTDFGPERGKVWSNSQPEHFTLHAKGDTWADVTEGSNIFGGVWERLHYDWSDPDCITLTTIESNVWSNRSSWRYRFDTTEPGQTTITYTIERFPQNIRARVIMLFVGVAGKRLIRNDFRSTLRAIEQQT